MSGLGIVIPTTGPGVGPIIPSPLPSPGVAGYAHRYAGVRLTGVDGAAVASWADSGSVPAPLTPGGGTGTVTVMRNDAVFPYARINGRQLASTIADSRPGSFAMVVRKSVVSQTILDTMGVRVNRAANGNYQLVFGTGGGGAGTTFTVSLSSVDWVCVVGTATNTAQTLRVNTATASGAFTPGTPTVTSLGSATAGQVTDLADLVLWPGVTFDATQQLAVYNAMRAAYPSVLP